MRRGRARHHHRPPPAVSTWVKSVDCECEECGPDPCTSGCCAACAGGDADPVLFTVSGAAESPGTCFDYTYCLGSHGVEPGCQEVCGFTLYVKVVSFFPGCTVQFELQIDGVVELDTGLVAGTNYYTIDVPAGATTVCGLVTAVGGVGTRLYTCWVSCDFMS